MPLRLAMHMSVPHPCTRVHAAPPCMCPVHADPQQGAVIAVIIIIIIIIIVVVVVVVVVVIIIIIEISYKCFVL